MPDTLGQEVNARLHYYFQESGGQAERLHYYFQETGGQAENTESLLS